MRFAHLEHERDFFTPTLKLALLLFLQATIPGVVAESHGGGLLRPPAPHIGAQVPPAQRASLIEAFEEAYLRVGSSPICASLFDGLDLTGPAALEASLYNYGGASGLKRACATRVGAVTRVGGRMVHLCRDFHRLMREDKVVILLHEALHTAGQSEGSNDSSAPTSGEITRRVRAACSERGRVPAQR